MEEIKNKVVSEEEKDKTLKDLVSIKKIQNYLQKQINDLVSLKNVVQAKLENYL